MKCIPSKTFLLGEYVAMYGGPAMVALTNPCFGMDMTKRLHPACMAARLWHDQRGAPCDWGLKDPYVAKGGMGASSAEFLLAYQALFTSESINLLDLHQTFLRYANNGTGRLPSGYDVLAQTGQGCVVVESSPLKVNSMPWNLDELGFVLVHTENKLATHTHLSQLDLDLNWKVLANHVEQGCEAMLASDADQWLQAIDSFYQNVLQQHLVSSYTQHLISKWKSQMPILAAKGCGAMGSDVIVMFARVENITDIVEKLHHGKHHVLATQRELYFENAKN